MSPVTGRTYSTGSWRVRTNDRDSKAARCTLTQNGGQGHLKRLGVGEKNTFISISLENPSDKAQDGKYQCCILSSPVSYHQNHPVKYNWSIPALRYYRAQVKNSRAVC